MSRALINEQEAAELARSYFLTSTNIYGCAESTFLVLKRAFGLPDVDDSSAAMALNGGVARGGGICGAISGAALAVGMLAGRRIDDHLQAKRVARGIIEREMDQFATTFGSLDCRDLIGIDIRIPAEHERFIESGIWRHSCMRQIEFAVSRLSALADEAVWDATVAELEAEDPNSV